MNDDPTGQLPAAPDEGVFAPETAEPATPRERLTAIYLAWRNEHLGELTPAAFTRVEAASVDLIERLHAYFQEHGDAA